jgi:hypothetical protein
MAANAEAGIQSAPSTAVGELGQVNGDGRFSGRMVAESRICVEFSGQKQ